MKSANEQLYEYLALVNGHGGVLGHFHQGFGGVILHMLDEIDLDLWLHIGLDDGLDTVITYEQPEEFGVEHNPPVVVRCISQPDGAETRGHIFLPPDAHTKIAQWRFETANPFINN